MLTWSARKGSGRRVHKIPWTQNAVAVQIGGDLPCSLAGDVITEDAPDDFSLFFDDLAVAPDRFAAHVELLDDTIAIDVAASLGDEGLGSGRDGRAPNRAAPTKMTHRLGNLSAATREETRT